MGTNISQKPTANIFSVLRIIILGYDAMFLGKWFVTFQGNMET